MSRAGRALPSAALLSTMVRPPLSAQQTLTRAQKISGALILLLIIAGFVFATLTTLIAIVAVLTAFYLINAVYKAYLIYLAMTRQSTIPVSREELAALHDNQLAIYTILVPVYHEANVIGGLVDSLALLDYPMQKLDVKILLEEDDAETWAAVAALNLPPYIHPVVVPAGKPKGKPRACNYGLRLARGKYCVIYDAEDRPDPDQLKTAIVAFRKHGPKLACVQAKLNYFNAQQNLLTRWFSIEYATWFDLYLPGLTHTSAPIPLGGTSNHFRVTQLRRVGAWDPFNVTEDADLGVRLASQGYTTGLIDSTTYEEANSQTGNWIRQRSRWIKGYMQTWLVHMRSPGQLWRRLGPFGFLGFQVMILGTVIAALVNPLFWVLLVIWYTTHAGLIQAIYPAPLIYFAATGLFAGNLIAAYSAIAGCLKRENYSGVRYTLILPVYWLLMSVAGWKALLQLIRNPHYWEKTRHGLTHSVDVVPAATPVPAMHARPAPRAVQAVQEQR